MPGHCEFCSIPFNSILQYRLNAYFDCNTSVVIQRRCSFSHKKGSYLTKNTTKLKVPRVQVKAEQELDDEACELVSGFELNLGEGADSVRASLFKAVKNNNETGVLLLSDVFGFEDSATRDFAYRVACNGYKYVP